MSLFDLTFMAMGGIIGAGIFSSVGSGIGVTGRSITLALIVGMLFQMSQQVRYVFTSSMFKVSGGMYSQDALVLTPYLTGVAGVMLFIQSLNWAVYGISIASYLGDLFPVLKNFPELTAAGALAVFFIIGYIGVQPLPRCSTYLVSSSSLLWACSSSTASARFRPADLKASPTSTAVLLTSSPQLP